MVLHSVGNQLARGLEAGGLIAFMKHRPTIMRFFDTARSTAKPAAYTPSYRGGRISEGSAAGTAAYRPNGANSSQPEMVHAGSRTGSAAPGSYGPVMSASDGLRNTRSVGSRGDTRISPTGPMMPPNRSTEDPRHVVEQSYRPAHPSRSTSVPNASRALSNVIQSRSRHPFPNVEATAIYNEGVVGESNLDDATGVQSEVLRCVVTALQQHRARCTCPARR